MLLVSFLILAPMAHLRCLSKKSSVVDVSGLVIEPGYGGSFLMPVQYKVCWLGGYSLQGIEFGFLIVVMSVQHFRLHKILSDSALRHQQIVYLCTTWGTSF